MAIWVFIGLGALFVLLVAADIYLGRHPLKRADKRADKYKYRGF